jgi:acyl-CoA reductase-like NAD-dependent aldehyde dehydrogenase
MPWEKDVFITPLPEPEKPAFLQELIGDALAKGAAVVNEGGGKQEQSLVFPTVLYPVDASMRIFHEEQFGPVIPVAVFDHIDEPVRYIMESNYGQQVSLFSNNADEIASLIDPLVNQVCRININAKCQRGPDIFPFSGRKDSAESTLSVHDALKVFSIRTLVATKGNAINQAIFDEIAESGQSNFLSSKPY